MLQVGLIFGGLGGPLLGCASRSEELQEWTPKDHQHTTTPNAGQVTTAEAQDPSAQKPPPGLDDVTVVAWRRNCLRCHGVVGRGDGPQGTMMAATDLSKPEWQAKISDEQIAESIRRGKGAMPAFDLPESTVNNLVKLVRLFDAARPENGGQAPAPSAAVPSGSTAPSAAVPPTPGPAPARPSTSAGDQAPKPRSAP